MSPHRAGWLLLLLTAGAAAADARGAAATMAVAAAAWALAAAQPDDVRWHPAAGAWLVLAAWTGFCAVLSHEPWLGTGPWWREATGALVLVLAGSWWGGAHRRAFLIGLSALGALGALTWAARQGGFVPGAWEVWLPRSSSAAFLASVAVAGGLAASTAPALGGAGLLFGSLTLGAVGAWAGGFSETGWTRVWTAVVAAAGADPVGGAGPGLAFRVLGGPAYAACEPLQILVETGWIGLALYGWAAAESFPRGADRLDREGRACSAAFCAMLGASWAGDALSSPALRMVFMAAAGAAAPAFRGTEASSLPRVAELRELRRLPRWVAAAGLAAGFACAAPRILLRRALDASSSADPGRRVSALELAARLAPRDPAVQELLAREALFRRPARPGAALARIDEAVRLAPGDPVYLVERADLYGLVGDMERAAASARQALVLAPSFSGARLLLAECLARLGRREEAAAEASRAAFDRVSDPRGWDPARVERVRGALREVRAP